MYSFIEGSVEIHLY